MGGANLGDLRRDLLRLTARVQLLAAVAFWLILEIEIGDLLPGLSFTTKQAPALTPPQLNSALSVPNGTD